MRLMPCFWIQLTRPVPSTALWITRHALTYIGGRYDCDGPQGGLQG